MTRGWQVFCAVWFVASIAAYSLGRTVSRPQSDSPEEESSGRATALRIPTMRSQSVLQKFERRLPDLSDPSVHDELLDLARAWAADSPEQAVRRLAELEFDDPRNPFLFAALTEWVALHPDAALAWFRAAFPDEGATRDYLQASLVRGLARTDVEAAERLLLDARNSPERSGAVDFLVHAWLRDGFAIAASRVSDFAPGERRLRDRALRRLVTDLPADEIDPAKAWAQKLSDPADRLVAQKGIAASWSQLDPPAAAQWAPGPDELGEVATRWARIDPIAARQWLDASPDDPQFDLARRAFAGNTVNYDPGTAFAQIAKIGQAALRDQSFEQIGRMFVGQQPQRARVYLDGEGESSVPIHIRASLLEVFE